MPLPHSPIIQGYSTTAFYFYNECDCQDGGDQHANMTCQKPSLPNCRTYSDTLHAVFADIRNRSIPVGHLLIDSWWYGEGVFNGVSQWESDDSLMAQLQTFPEGLPAFSKAIGGLPIWAHNGKWVEDSPYWQMGFERAPGSTMPQGRALWDRVFSRNKEWNLMSIKQDHVAEQIAATKVGETNVSVYESWLQGMGDAAWDNDVNILYCCSPPLVMANSVNVKASCKKGSLRVPKKKRERKEGLPE